MPTTLQVSAVLTFAGFLAALYLLSWQIRIRPRDRQAWAALALIASLMAILGQLCWFYLGGPSLGQSTRGVVSYAAVMLSLVFLAWETRSINREILRRRRR